MPVSPASSWGSIHGSDYGGRAGGPPTENFGGHASMSDALTKVKAAQHEDATQALEKLHGQLHELPDPAAAGSIRQTADAYVHRLVSFASVHRYADAAQGRDAVTMMHRALGASMKAAQGRVDQKLADVEPGSVEHTRLSGVRNELIDFHDRMNTLHGDLQDSLRDPQAVHLITASPKTPLIHRPWFLAATLSTAAFGAVMMTALLLKQNTKQKLVIIRDRPPVPPAPPSGQANAANQPTQPSSTQQLQQQLRTHGNGGSPIVFIMPQPSQN